MQHPRFFLSILLAAMAPACTQLVRPQMPAGQQQEGQDNRHRYKPPCQDSADREWCDLEAQWSAASAARDAASSGHTQVIISWIALLTSAITFGAAVAAAIFARDAAREGQRSATAAEESGRPWLAIEPRNVSVGMRENGSIQANAEVWVTNKGSSPATGVKFEMRTTSLLFVDGWMNPDDAKTLLDDKFLLWEKCDGAGGQTLFQEEQAKTNWGSSVSADAISASLASGSNGNVPLFMVIAVSYWFLGKPRRTVAIYEFSQTVFPAGQYTQNAGLSLSRSYAT